MYVSLGLRLLELEEEGEKAGADLFGPDDSRMTWTLSPLKSLQLAVSPGHRRSAALRLLI